MALVGDGAGAILMHCAVVKWYPGPLLTGTLQVQILPAQP